MNALEAKQGEPDVYDVQIYHIRKTLVDHFTVTPEMRNAGDVVRVPKQ